jgi:chromosome segregation ATPase
MVAGALDARLELLADRLDAALDSAKTRPPAAGPGVGLARTNAEFETLAAELRAAESSAQLQAQRCHSLEDRIATLTSELAAARARQREAETIAEAALASPGSTPPANPPALRDHGATDLSQTLQAKLLEVERLTSELTALRRSNDEWRTRARGFRRELDAITGKHERAAASLRELEQREAQASKRVTELERLVAEQTRELEFAERRAKHLRDHMRSS